MSWFYLQRKNHENFLHEYEVRASQRAEGEENLDHMASHITENITYAAERYAPRNNRKKKALPPWWSPELTKMRKEVRAAARRKAARGRQIYNTKRNEYTRLLWKNKVSSWKNVCTLGGNHP